ncbi:MAG: MFS transporter, partial [Actinobacteria bacterium]|nr:MFS transporter [Actinomycetota bacterium]
MSAGSPGRLRRLVADTRPLSDPHFRRLFLGSGVAFIGFQLTAVAVAVQVYDITRSSFYVGLIGLVGLVPLIGFGLWGGSVADAVDRRLLLLVSSTLTWAVTGALFAQSLLGLHNVWLILALVAVQSAAFAVSSPTRGAIYPRLLPRELIPAANTLTFTMSTFAMAVGPLIAGVVIGRGHHYT